MGVPWIIGGVLLGVGLLGEWLLGPGGSSTQRPDGMPQSNTAVRGSPIYVTFGANRVYPQMTWSKNFNAVRQDSSGKGGSKGGGSGGFGSMKGGGAAGQQYEYYWDLMFNFGMFDQPTMISRGWTGGDPLDDNTVKSILNGAILGSGKTGNEDIFTAIIDYMKSLSQTQHTNATAQLKFTSCFYAPGYNTGDPNITTWDYFQTQTGFACQWPSTSWIGFQQLDLGQSPAVPQLSFEFLPQSANVVTGDGFLSKVGFGSDGSENIFNGWGLLRDDNQNIYAHSTATGSSGASHRVTITNVITSVQSKLTDTQFQIDCGALDDYIYSIPCPDTNFFYVLGVRNSPTGAALMITAYLYQVNTDGTISYTGSASSYDYVDDRFSVGANIKAIGKTNDGRIVINYFGSFSSTAYSIVQFLPNPNNFGSTAWSDPFRLEDFHDATDFSAAMGQCGSDRFNNLQAGLVTGPNSDDCWAFFYVGVGEISWHNSHSVGDPSYVKYIGDNAATYPNGFMVGALVSFTSGISDTGIHNDFFTNEAGDPLVPFADREKDFDNNSTGDVQDDWFTPTGGGFVVITRPYTTDHFTYRYDMLRNDGDGAKRDDSHRLFTTLTSSDIGASPPIATAIVPSVISNGSLFASVTYHGGSFNPGTVQISMGVTLLDVTPAYIVYRILTSEVFGFQTQALFGYSVTADRINTASYQQAVEWCVSQGIFVSVTYTTSDNLLNVFNELVSLYNGFLIDPGGVIHFGIVTGNDTPIRTIDNSHLVADRGKPPIKTTKAALEDGYNRIQFNYLDRALDYNQNQVQVDDEVDQDINTIRVKTYQARFVMNGSVAYQIANRALWQNLYGKDKYNFTLGWKDADLSQGDLITLVDSFDPTLNGGVRARIMKWKNKARGKYDVEAVREFPYIVTATVDYTQTSTRDQGFGGLVNSIQPCFHQTAYEVPAEMQGAKSYLYFGYEQASIVMGAQLYLSADGTNFVLTQDTQPFIISGVFNEALPSRPRGWVESDIDFYLFPTSPFNTASPTFVQTYDLDNVTEALRAQGAGVMIVGSEAVSIENLTLLGQNHYRAKRAYRGWAGTPISNHTSGEWFHHHAAGMFTHEIAASDIGNKIWYKIVPYNFAGQLANISSIDASTYSIKGTYWLPRPQPRSNIYVTSALTWPSSTPITGPYIAVTSGGSDIELTWHETSQHDGYGAQGYGAQGYGHDDHDGSITGWRVDVASKNGYKVSSSVVTSPYFQYTLTQNSTDFSGFAQDLIFSVTPFNAKGDGVSADVRSLSMIW